MTAITDQMIEQAAKALHHIDGTGSHPQWDLEWDYIKADYRQQAKAALEAVAPLITAQALRHEADNAPGAWEVPDGVYHLDRTSRNYLRARAEQIEGGTTDSDLEASLEWLESVAREREAGQ